MKRLSLLLSPPLSFSIEISNAKSPRFITFISLNFKLLILNDRETLLDYLRQRAQYLFDIN